MLSFENTKTTEGLIIKGPLKVTKAKLPSVSRARIPNHESIYYYFFHVLIHRQVFLEPCEGSGSGVSAVALSPRNLRCGRGLGTRRRSYL